MSNLTVKHESSQNNSKPFEIFYGGTEGKFLPQPFRTMPTTTTTLDFLNYESLITGDADDDITITDHVTHSRLYTGRGNHAISIGG